MSLLTSIDSYWKFDEASGDAADATGNGFTLTNNGTATYSAGIINNGGDLGTSNSSKYFSNATTCGLAFDTAFTVNFWVKMNTVPSNNTATYLWNWGDNSTTNKKGGMEVQYYNNSGTPELYIVRQQNAYGTNNQYGAAQTLTTGTWYMLTFTWDGSTESLYVNGSGSALVSGSSTITGSNSSNGTGTGLAVGRYLTGGSYSNAEFDEIGQWNRVLTSGEISSLYNSGAAFQYPFGLGATTGAALLTMV